MSCSTFTSKVSFQFNIHLRRNIRSSIHEASQYVLNYRRGQHLVIYYCKRAFSICNDLTIQYVKILSLNTQQLVLFLRYIHGKIILQRRISCIFIPGSLQKKCYFIGDTFKKISNFKVPLFQILPFVEMYHLCERVQLDEYYQNIIVTHLYNFLNQTPLGQLSGSFCIGLKCIYLMPLKYFC